MLNNEAIFQVIKTVVCKEENIDPNDFNDNLKRRLMKYVKAREYIMYFARLYTTMTLGEIGSMVGKDHSMVIYAIRLINEQKDIYKSMASKIDIMNRNIMLKISIEENRKESSMNIIRDHVVLCLESNSRLNPEIIEEYNRIVETSAVI